MRFGFFDQLPCAAGFTEHQRYKDIIAQIELGEDVGSIRCGSGNCISAAAFRSSPIP